MGIPFGGVLLALAAGAEPLSRDRIVAWAVTELLFPVGCVLILFSAARAERAGQAAGAG